MDRRLLLGTLLAVACSKGEAPASQTGAVAADSAAGTVAGAPGARASAAATPAAPSAAGGTTGAAAPNLQGRIPVLEYHVIGGDKNTLYTRTAATYRNDLDTAYKLGYRPITVAQMLDKDFRDVPAATRSSATRRRTASWSSIPRARSVSGRTSRRTIPAGRIARCSAC